MLEKLLLASAVTFSVYVFSGVQFPSNFRLPLAFGTSETSTPIKHEGQLIRFVQDSENRAAPLSKLANNSVNQ
jgi:hypothetical protein